MKKKFTQWLSKVSLALLLYCLCFSVKASSNVNLLNADKVEETPASLKAFPVQGKVISDDGEELPGVTVMVKGTSVGTITDAFGNYALDVPDGSEILVFSYVGFLTEEEVISSRSQINITLVPDITQLQEVVVVGYGTQMKRDITGSIASVSEEAIGQRQSVNVFDAMQGAAPGVQINSNSGAPGAGSSITIRGASTLSDEGSQPLFIVDGMIVEDIDMINPNDIKSIEILKDAASASIYGARSANGVIIVTTKTGESGKPKVDVRYLRSWSQISKTLPQVNKFERVLNHHTTRGQVLEKYSANADSVGLVGSTSNFYQDMLTQTAVRNDVGLTVSGGSDKIKYFTSLNYIDEEGIILTSFAKRFNLRTNIDYQATERLKFGSRISLGYITNNNISEAGVLDWSLRRITDYIVWYPDGSLAPVYNMGGQRNPIQELEARKRLTNRYQGNFNQYGEYKITDWLQFKASVTGTVDLNRYSEFTGKELDSNGNEDLRKNSGADRTSWRWTILTDAYFSANKTIGDHTVTGLIGTSAENGKSERFHYAGNNFVTESGIITFNSIQDLNISQTFTDATDYAIAGFFGRAGYSFRGKYILNATARYDGSSRFGKNNRWGLFPSASVGWRFSDETFMSWSRSWLNDGKIRASYGITGNDRIGNYESQTRYSFGNFYNGISGVTSVNQYGNPNLRWEQTTQSNLGLDLAFFDGRLNFVGDYYVKSTKDLLADVNLPSSTGYSTMRTNLAALENKGLELSIAGYPIAPTARFSWHTSVNWSKNVNRITDLAKEDYVQSNVWYVAANTAAGNFYGYKQLGIYQYDASNAYTDDYSTRLIPMVKRDAQNNVIIAQNGEPIVEGYTYPDGSSYNGEIKQLTTNGVVVRGGDVIWQNLPDENGVYDDKIDDADRMILGNAQPKWDLGWNNTITHRNWSLSFNIYARWGGTIYNKLKWDYSRWVGNMHNQHPEYVRTGWKWPGQETDWYWISNNRNYNYRELSDFFLEEASFIRLRNVRLSYQLDPNISEKARLSNVMVYVYGNNLLTWTNYSGYDPEIGGGVLTPGRDAAIYPRKKEVGVGINISF